MLVLTRHPKEDIMIGDNIRLTVHEVNNGVVTFLTLMPVDHAPPSGSRTYQRGTSFRVYSNHCEVGATFNISDEVTIMLIGLRRKQVRIGINAPKHVPVHRMEIYRRIQQSESEAA